MIAWACIDPNGKPWATEMSPHAASIGRLYIYRTRADALQNELPERIVEVEIKIKGGKRERKPR